MDTQAGYYALDRSKQCKMLGEAEIRAVSRQAMLNFDRTAKEKGKTVACRWADDLEKTISRD